MLPLLKDFFPKRYFRTLVLVALTGSWLAAATWADPQGPTPGERTTANFVTKLLKQKHLLRKPLDNVIRMNADIAAKHKT